MRTVLTRTGTNEFRGRGSFYYRDKAFDAVNYFVNHDEYKGEELPKDQWEKSPYEHFNFSGFLGGPLKKDKAHFFLSYDGTRHTEYATITSPLVPRDTIDVGADVNQVLVKLNLQPNENNLFAFRYTLYHGLSTNVGAGGWFTREQAYDSLVETHDFQLNWTFYPSDNTMNEFRILYANTLNDVITDIPDSYAISRPSGQFGARGNVPQQTVENRYQLVDNFSIFAGNHSIKLGFDASYVPLHGFVNQYIPGLYYFGTDEPFDPAVFATYPLFILYNTSDPNFDFPYKAVGIFVQDSWRIHPRLTLNLGLRYNYFTCEGLDMDNANIRNLNPRFGFSWDPVGDGRTSIRGGIGTFSNNPILNAGMIGGLMNSWKIKQKFYPGYPDPSVINPFFPDIIEADVPLAAYGAIDKQVTPYTVQTTIGFQREFVTDLSLGADFIWTQGFRLMRLEQHNPVIPGTGSLRPDMTMADFMVITDHGTSDYKGLYLTLNKRYSHGWSLEIAYTFSRSWSDVEQENYYPHSYDDDNWEKQYGPTNRDARHRLAVNGIFDLPFGFQLSGLMYYRSAIPFNAIYSYDMNLDSLRSDYVDDHRNARRGFSEFYLNTRISKFINVGRFRLQVFGELYNLTNKVNFSGPNPYFDYTDQFGKPIAAGSPRLIQLGARIDF